MKTNQSESDYGWYPSEYKIDIHERLKILEKERHVFQNRSPQKEYRISLIKWLRKLFTKVEFSRVTLHLAVFLLDFFMDSHSIKPEKLTLIALICFILAGKFVERDTNIPKIPEMNEILKCTYLKTDFIYLEKTILKHFKWKLTMPTALNFAEFYMDYAIVSDDICQNCSNYQYVYTVIRNAVNDYLDITLEDDSLIKHPPSFVAASCILAVRKSFSLNPIWPDKLKNISSYTESELTDCATHIFEFRGKHQNQRKRKLEQSPDQGYETGSADSPCSLKSRK